MEHFLTDKKPIAYVEANTILFDRMIIKTGSIDDIYFEVSWKYPDPNNANFIVNASNQFHPQSYISPYSMPSKTHFEFRKYDPLPLMRFVNNKRDALITAKSRTNSPFDITLFVINNPVFSRT